MTSKHLWDRLAAVGGITFVVLYVVGTLLPGQPPTVEDSATDVVAFFTDSRGAFLAGIFITVVGSVAFLWFVSSLVAAMREAGEDPLATAALGAFLTFIAVGSVAALIRASLAFGVAADLDPDQARAFFHVSAVTDLFSMVFFAAFAAAVGGASLRTGFLPRLWGWISMGVAVAFLIAGTAWSRDGFWSPTGGAAAISALVWLVYILVTSVLQFRQVGSAGPDG